MKKILFCLVLFLCFASANVSHAQTYSWPLIRMAGDTVWANFPPPDSTYNHRKLILRFKDNAINRDSICYDCNELVEMGTHSKNGQPLSSQDPWWECKKIIMQQRFTVNIIGDATVRTILSSHGVTSLRRMTAANPCADTMSLTRRGDTLWINDFDWMVAEFNNDTSIVSTLTALYLFYTGTVEVAEPDYIIPLATTTPCDPEFIASPTRQSSLQMIGMPAVWPYTVGDPSIRVAVVDHGVDYWRCDLGGGLGNGNKVVDGWNYLPGYPDPCTGLTIPPSAQGIFIDSYHGTAVASIIGALTDNAGCGLTAGVAHGMAGIAGGQGTICGDPYRGTGVSIIGFQCAGQFGDPGVDPANTASAILESAAASINGHYGFGAHLINLSQGGRAAFNSIVYHNATTAAYDEGVSVIASSGDGGSSTPIGPADFEPASEVITVGGSDHTMARGSISSFNTGHVDLLAPGPDKSADNIVGSLANDGGDCTAGSSGLGDQYQYFWETSAAAAHVTGVASLLWGYLPTIGITSIFPEDIEGMLKASALDIGLIGNGTPRQDPNITPTAFYTGGYDIFTGWGFLKADKLFTMLDPAGPDAYTLQHVEATIHDMDTTAAFSTDFVKFSLIAPIFRSSSNKHGGEGPNVTALTTSTTVYNTHFREITGHASYAGLGITTGKPVYVWGNGGGKRGRANTNWNFSESWCEVSPGDDNASGTYGSGNGIVPGIEHSSSTTVHLRTFQFELFDASTGAFIKRYPANDELGLGFSVFGATKVTSGVSQAVGDSKSLRLWPSIATNEITIASDQNISRLIIIDILGRIVLEKNYITGDEKEIEIPTTDLITGSYIARIFTGKSFEECNFIVKH